MWVAGGWRDWHGPGLVWWLERTQSICAEEGLPYVCDHGKHPVPVTAGPCVAAQRSILSMPPALPCPILPPPLPPSRCPLLQPPLLTSGCSVRGAATRARCLGPSAARCPATGRRRPSLTTCSGTWCVCIYGAALELKPGRGGGAGWHAGTGQVGRRGAPGGQATRWQGCQYGPVPAARLLCRGGVCAA